MHCVKETHFGAFTDFCVGVSMSPFVTKSLKHFCCFLSCLTVYDVSGGAGDRNCVVLNDIHIDIMDYIVPATCTDSEFRQMWAEFEWENKVN